MEHLSMRKQKLILLIVVVLEFTNCSIEQILLGSKDSQINSFEKEMKNEDQKNERVYNRIQKT